MFFKLHTQRCNLCFSLVRGLGVKHSAFTFIYAVTLYLQSNKKRLYLPNSVTRTRPRWYHTEPKVQHSLIADGQQRGYLTFHLLFYTFHTFKIINLPKYLHTYFEECIFWHINLYVTWIAFLVSLNHVTGKITFDMKCNMKIDNSNCIL